MFPHKSLFEPKRYLSKRRTKYRSAAKITKVMTAKVNGDAGSSRVISLARFIMGTYYYLPLVVPQDV
jgi:hypothetical protein